MNSKIGSDVQILSFEQANAMAVRIVIDILQFIQDGEALFTLLLIVCKLRIIYKELSQK